jgi:3-isopropylmalate/(R)-2-methylmalate dehydratase small subunit
MSGNSWGDASRVFGDDSSVACLLTPPMICHVPFRNYGIPSMQPFVEHRGQVAVLDWTDVNTDLIIPARYLKRVERTGFGPLLFADKRYVAGGAPEIDEPERHGPENPEFPLNNPALRGATVLVAGRNFGCGSSREHAVWAVMQAGYRAIIAPGKGEGFADIFESNAFNNGLLVIELDQNDWQTIASAGQARPGSVEVSIDLRDRTIILHQAEGARAQQTEPTFSFEVPESHRNRMLLGLDAIAETLLLDSEIRRHEQLAPSWILPQQVAGSPT